MDIFTHSQWLGDCIIKFKLSKKLLQKPIATESYEIYSKEIINKVNQMELQSKEVGGKPMLSENLPKRNVD